MGLDESVRSFLAAYTVTAPSVQVLVFTVGAPSSTAAVQRASALATAYLQFRDSYLQNQQELQVKLAQQQLTAAQQKVTSLNRQVAAVSAEPVTTDQQASLRSLQAQLNTAETALTAAQQNESAVADTAASTVAAMVHGSQVINAPTAVPRSLKQKRVFYLVLAFIAGLAIGLAIIIIRALVSSRLRSRDDIAEAIGSPVMLSIGEVGANWLPPLGRRRGRMRGLDLQRLEAHLNNAIAPPRAGYPAALAVVAVDNAPDAAPAVVSLALAWAGQGKKVVVADLCHGAPAARLLGSKSPGVHTVSVSGAQMAVTVPGRAEVAPVGPLASPRPPFGRVNSDVAAACASADLLLTLITLEPVAGADHLATWATDAVAVATAGLSTSTRVRAVGEMIRLAGVRMASVVLLRADKSDESLGARHALDLSAPALPL